jgi:hypothetical protein
MYSVAITSKDIAYGLLLNDAQATVTDNKGSLTLVGSGGTANPNGALTINAGTFVLNGGALDAGNIAIGSGGALQIANGTYTGSNALSETITDNGSLIDQTTTNITGSISGTGTVLAQNNANLTIDGSLAGFTGFFTIANKGVLEFDTTDSANVSFASGSSGTVKYDAQFTGTISTGTISGLTPKDSIDLADLPFVSGQMKATPSSTGVTVTNGTDTVVINLAGNFTNATWRLSPDKTGGTMVVDPPAANTPVNSSPGLDQAVALFNQSIAGGFPDEHGVLNTNPLSQVVTNEQQFLAQPHHG